MTALLIILAVVYIIGVLGAAGAGLLDWSMYRSLQRDLRKRPLLLSNEEWLARYEADARAAARRFVQSPLWPLLALGALVRIYADSKEA